MFGADRSLTLFRIAGIRVGANPSWFVVLFLFIFVLSGSFRNALDGSQSEAYLVAVASALLFFLSLVLHELGHALAARSLGIPITGIELWFFGGMARMSGDTRSPGEEFRVAIAGPAVTFLVVLACAGAGLISAGPDGLLDAALIQSEASLPPGLLLLGFLATMNGFLLAFNLIPAFPLDGGRIARAIAWKVTGDRGRGTRFAARIGEGFSYLMMAGGLYLALLGGALGSGLWMLVLGWFLGQGARTAVAQSAISDRLEGLLVSDVMDQEPVAIPAGTPIARAHDEFFLRYGWEWFPVIDDAGRPLGMVRAEPVAEAERAHNGEQAVSAVMEAGDGDMEVSQSEPLEELLGSSSLRRHGALMATNADGVLSGVVTLDQLMRALSRGPG